MIQLTECGSTLSLYRAKQGVDIMIHVTAVESMAAQLNDLGVIITQFDLTTKIVCSLPDEFESVVRAWENVPDDLKKMDTLRERLASEQRRINSRKNASTTQQRATQSTGSSTLQPDITNALYGYGNRGGHNSSRGNYRGSGGWRGKPNQGHGQRDQRTNIDRDNAKCTYCNKPRHYEFECRNRIADEGDKQNKEKRVHFAGQSSHQDCSLVSIHCLKSTNQNALYLDSGATRHMSGERSYFHELTALDPDCWPVNGIGETTLHAHGIGTIKIVRKVDGRSIYGTIKDVLFVPDLGVTLLSIASITNNGLEVTFKGCTALVTHNDKLIMMGTRTGDSLYQVDVTPICSPTMGLAAASQQASLNIWHQRFGHINELSLSRMAAGVGVKRMEITPGKGKLDDCCDGCNLGKMHKLPFPTSTSQPSVVGELVVSDVVGPIQEPSVGGARYYIIFKDMYSRYKTAYFIKQKSESEESFKHYINRLYADTGKRVKVFRSDNGGEFTSHSFAFWLAQQGIKHQTCAAYTPEQNGFAERDHRTTVESARSQIHAKGAPLKLWAEAVNHAVYVLNRSLTDSKNVTPYELWHGKPPDVSRIRVFGAPTYFLIPDPLRQKLDPKATKGVYVGESENQKASRVYVESSGRTHITRDLRVYETLPYWTDPEKSETIPEPTITGVNPGLHLHNQNRTPQSDDHTNDPTTRSDVQNVDAYPKRSGTKLQLPRLRHNTGRRQTALHLLCKRLNSYSMNPKATRRR